MRMLSALLGLLLAGCTGDPVVPGKIDPPAARLMQKAPELPDVAPGADLADTTAQCRAEYGRQTGKLERLQAYVRLIAKK